MAKLTKIRKADLVETLHSVFYGGVVSVIEIEQELDRRELEEPGSTARTYDAIMTGKLATSA